jgi:hypothetical protein
MVSLSSIKKASLEEEQETSEPITYRAIRTGKWLHDKEMYLFCDIYELSCVRRLLHRENFDWFLRNPGKSLPMLIRNDYTDGNDKGRLTLRKPPLQYYSQTGFDYTIVAKSLKGKRFFYVSEADVDEFQKGAEELQEVVYVGHIPGVAVISEIAWNTTENVICHPVIADTTEDPEPRLDAGEIDGTNTSTFETNYIPVECDHYDCPICYGALMSRAKPEWFIIGLPINAPEVIELRTRKAKIEKLQRWKKFMTAMRVMDMTWMMLDSIDAIDNDSELKAQARAEVEREMENEQKK